MNFVKLQWMTKHDYLETTAFSVNVYQKTKGTHIVVDDYRPGRSVYALEVEEPMPLQFVPVPYERRLHSHGKVCVIAANSTPDFSFMLDPGVLVITEHLC